MSFKFPRSLTLPLLAVLAAGGVADAHAPSPRRQQDSVAEDGARLPFGAGERATYQVRLGGVRVGSGSMHVVGIEKVHGHDTYHARFRLSGGVPLARVDDRFDTWIDVDELFSRRFKQDQREVRYERRRTYEFFPERREYRRTDKDETGPIPTDRPLDDISFLYYARTLPLRVGETYRLNRYFKESGNPVVLRVMRRENVTVPAGTFRTIVVRPTIRTRGLFGEGGEAEVYLSDDARKIPVLIRSRVPVVGSLTMHLETYQPGTPR
ncbi:MAG TPA: DUF3108 domain-containing protein [Longimicrobiaceae bacterium]|nr:DUF3108 domain-containing protein [Longimicrobiaceae bacterium]